MIASQKAKHQQLNEINNIKTVKARIVKTGLVFKEIFYILKSCRCAKGVFVFTEPYQKATYLYRYVINRSCGLGI